MKPGDVVGPGEKPEENVQVPAAQPAVSAPAVAPESPVQPTNPTPPTDRTVNSLEQESASANQTVPTAPSQETVIWTASEYIAHDKSGGWYVLLGLAAVGIAGLVFVITREVVSTVVILVMGLAFGAFAARKPQELTYELGSSALRIGQKTYSYNHFKSFSIIEEGAVHSIMLMPLPRFMPPLSIYYDPQDEDKITNALSHYLPYVDRKQDAVDRLMRRVRF